MLDSRYLTLPKGLYEGTLLLLSVSNSKLVIYAVCHAICGQGRTVETVFPGCSEYGHCHYALNRYDHYFYDD